MRLGPRVLLLAVAALALSTFAHAGVIYDITITTGSTPAFEAAHTFTNYLDLMGGTYTFTVADILQDPTAGTPGVRSFYAGAPLVLWFPDPSDPTTIQVSGFELDVDGNGLYWTGPDATATVPADATGTSSGATQYLANTPARPENRANLTVTITQDNAVPEPATVLPVLGTLAALATYVRKRRRQ